MLAHHPLHQPAIKCSARGHQSAHPHQLLSGHDSTKTCQIAAPGCCCSLLTTPGKQIPASIAALQRGMAASQAGGFQGLAFPLPEGQKLLPETFYPLCTLHETRLDRRRRSGRTNQVGLGLQLDGWMDGQPGREVVPR